MLSSQRLWPRSWSLWVAVVVSPSSGLQPRPEQGGEIHREEIGTGRALQRTAKYLLEHEVLRTLAEAYCIVFAAGGERKLSARSVWAGEAPSSLAMANEVDDGQGAAHTASFTFHRALESVLFALLAAFGDSYVGLPSVDASFMNPGR